MSADEDLVKKVAEAIAERLGGLVGELNDEVRDWLCGATENTLDGLPVKDLEVDWVEVCPETLEVTVHLKKAGGAREKEE
jgi:hypothetical protein